MKKLKLTAVLEYDDESMHGSNDPEAIEWFRKAILMGETDDAEPLLLLSSEIGDTIGEVRVLSIEDVG